MLKMEKVLKKFKDLVPEMTKTDFRLCRRFQDASLSGPNAVKKPFC
jgi:hypothetical protein